MNVSDSERKTDKLKKENDELRNRLNNLKIDSAAAAGDGETDIMNKF